MSRKLTTEILKKEAKIYGYELLDEYKQKEKLRVVCKGGHIQKIYPHRFKKAKCKKCLDIEKANKIRAEIESKGYTLRNEYQGISTVLEMTCPNGHKRNCKINSFRVNDCKQCVNNMKLKKLLHKISESGYEIVSYPSNAKDVMKAICPNGHFREAQPHNFINHNCIECDGRPIKYDYDFCVQAFKNKGFLLIEDEYLDCKTKMRYICVCGEKRETTLDILLNTDIDGCRQCMGERFSGENHSNWKGGISSEQSKIRGTFEYAQWRKFIFRRDGYLCQCCGIVGGKLNAHHIENFSSNENKRLDKDNGITLCESCHTNFHRCYGKKNNNLKQLQEYIHDYNFECFMSV